MKKDTSEMIRFDFSNMMAEHVGTQHGITVEELRSVASRAGVAASRIALRRMEGDLTWTGLPHDKKACTAIKEYADRIRNQFENFVVLGIGGSALGNRAIHSAVNHPFHNLLPRKARGNTPRIFILDNVDPQLIQGLISTIDIEKTLFNVITKSGTTAETMANFLVFREMLMKKVGKKCARHIVATTDAQKGALRSIAQKEGYQTFDIPEGVGGRFSVLSDVGLLSAAVSGVDIDELLRGARDMDHRCCGDDLWDNPALMAATLLYGAHRLKEKNIVVMMPYSHRLRDAADWFRQLWAESLGKKYSVTDEVVHAGSTPVVSVGVTDQHSQLQLYEEGPFDKVVAFLRVEDFDAEGTIPHAFSSLESVAYLGGHSLSELMNSEQKATEIALTKNERLNCTYDIPAVNAYTLGQLFFLLELQTAYTGELYQVNTYDQPGVEEGKRLAYGMLGRKGFEEKAREVKESMERSSQYCI